MNLAVKDIRHNLGRFGLTTLGVGMLLMVVMAMGGIYRGLVEEGTLLVNRIGADIWVIQRDTRGPIAEISRVPRTLVDRVAAVPGVTQAREFVMHTIQRERSGKRFRAMVVGLSWPTDKGEWIPLVEGRALAQNHYEMIADQSLGLRLGESIGLGKEQYVVVGVTRGMTSWGGDGTAFFTLADAQAIQFDVSGEATRLERSARWTRWQQDDTGRAQPFLMERSARLSSELPALGPAAISAVVARISPGSNPNQIVKTINGWSDVSVLTREQECDLILKGAVERSRKQLGLFRTILIVVSAIIMTLIIYTLTLDKLHSLAMLKLMGARRRVLLGMILQQAIAIGMLGFVIARLLGLKLFPLFPRRIVITTQDLIQLSLIVLGISILASGLGLWRALRVSPNVAISR